MINRFKIIYTSIFLGLVAMPHIAFAQPKDFKELINIFIDVIQSAIPVVVGLAVLFFFWGLVKYIFSQGNEESKIEGKNIMVWGLIGLFFIFSIYGVIRLFGGILPKFPGGSGGSAPTYESDSSSDAFHQDIGVF